MTIKDKHAWLFVDIGNGDQCKGSFVDFTTRHFDAHTVVRFNGGAQAGHGVVTPEGLYHIFAQFSSGTFVPGVATFLSRFMLLDPWRMMVEEEQLQKLGVTDAYDRTFVSDQALVISPFQAIANRLREWVRGNGRHGSCGLGIGETVKDSLELGDELVLRVKDLQDLDSWRAKMIHVQAHKREQLWDEGVMSACWSIPEARQDLDDLINQSVIEEFLIMLEPWLEKIKIVADEYLGQILDRPGTVIFEPAQGVLLDECRGFHPYTTWSNCTLDNALTLLAEHDYQGQVHKIGITRAYGTRHGPGPFVVDNPDLSAKLPDPPSARNDWQGAFRVGWFDALAARYAIACCGQLDALAVSCLDRLKSEQCWQICTSYRLPDDLVDSDEIDTYFERDPEDRSLVRHICLGPFRDLEYQARLTELLFLVKPVYETTAIGPISFYECVNQHLARISQELGLPVHISSFGPTANDKRLYQI